MSDQMHSQSQGDAEPAAPSKEDSGVRRIDYSAHEASPNCTSPISQASTICKDDFTEEYDTPQSQTHPPTIEAFQQDSNIPHPHHPGHPDDKGEAGSPTEVDSQESISASRSYRRGGRRKAATSSSGRAEDVLLEQAEQDLLGSKDHVNTQKRIPRGNIRSTVSGARKRLSARIKGTRARTFNVERVEEPEGGGQGAQPLGVTDEQPKPSTKSVPKRRQFKDGDEKKCVSIRFDLNLVVEILLKVKIQGDVTITFL